MDTIPSVFKRHPLLLELVLIPLAMATLYLYTFARLIFGERNISTFQDNTYLFHPLFHHIATSFNNGEYPYWMNTILAGLPLYSSPQFSLTYPFYFFQFGLYSTPLNTAIDTQYVILFHFFVLYLNTYVMLRVFRLSPLPALLGSSLLALSASTASYGAWINHAAAYSWFPLVIAAVFLVLENRRAQVGVLLGVFSLSLLTLAMPAHPLIQTSFAIGVLYLFYAVRYFRKRETRMLVHVSKNMVVLATLTLLISSPMIIPALLESRNMIRFLGHHGAIGAYAKMPFEAFLVGQLEPRALAACVLPLRVPLILGNPFVGMSPVLFALFGALRVRTDFIVLPIVFLSVYGLLSATGSHLGFAQVNYHLPLLNRIREPGVHLFLFVFGVSTLAAFGFSYLTAILKRGDRALLNLKHVPVLVVFLGLVVAAFTTSLPFIGSMAKTSLLAMFALAMGLLFTLRWVSGWQGRAIALAVILVVIVAHLQYPRREPRWQDGDYFKPENLISHDVLSKLAEIQDIRNYRILFADDNFNPQFWSMNASYYGLRSFRSYMNPLPGDHIKYVVQRWKTRHYYPLLGTKYYLCNPCDMDVLRDYEVMTEISGYKLNVAKQALPRYAIMSRVGGSYTTPEEFFGKINAGGYDYTQEFYVRDKDFATVTNWLGKPSSSSVLLKEEQASLNNITLSVHIQDRAVFILNEVFTNAWKARVNGVAVQVMPVNATQMGVLLEKGANFVEFEYHPTLFIQLLWLQRVTVLGLLFYIAYRGVIAVRIFLGTWRICQFC